MKKTQFRISSMLIAIGICSVLIASNIDSITFWADQILGVKPKQVRQISTADELREVLENHDNVIFIITYDWSTTSIHLSNSANQSKQRSRRGYRRVLKKFELIEILMSVLDPDEGKKIYEVFNQLDSQDGIPPIDRLHSCDGLAFWKINNNLFFSGQVFDAPTLLDKTQELLEKVKQQ